MGIDGPAWRHRGGQKTSRHLNNTPSPVFCDLIMICLRIMAVRRWRVCSLLTSGSKEKQMDC